jgi:hypothetical protein
MLETYIPPKNWWRRERKVQVSIWPRWLAQLLCPHEVVGVMAFSSNVGETSGTLHSQCSECYKKFKTHGHINEFYKRYGKTAQI